MIFAETYCISALALESQFYDEKLVLYRVLGNYARFIMKDILPEDTKSKPVLNKMMLEERKIKPWFEAGGAFI
jgi:hypothetical protein